MKKTLGAVTAKVRVRQSPPGAFEQLKRRVTSNSHQAAYNYARAVVKDAKLRVPVRTGYLRDHIMWERVSPGKFNMFVEGNKDARTGAFYGVYVEYGTRHMAAQPFFTPAVMSQKAAFMADMKAVFR